MKKRTFFLMLFALIVGLSSCEDKEEIAPLPTEFEEDVEEQRPAPKSIRKWNQEYYVSFGSGTRCWSDARKYGFISAGGGTWYSNTLKLLSPGDRINLCTSCKSVFLCFKN